mmetsp:Transcript_52340/g.132268  ORF Transcript_52340/g.132268 Transcript_52340/m.132268 type:complete len:217 (+) Transcript_52340:158-808(+)
MTTYPAPAARRRSTPPSSGMLTPFSSSKPSPAESPSAASSPSAPFESLALSPGWILSAAWKAFFLSSVASPGVLSFSVSARSWLVLLSVLATFGVALRTAEATSSADAPFSAWDAASLIASTAELDLPLLSCSLSWMSFFAASTVSAPVLSASLAAFSRVWPVTFLAPAFEAMSSNFSAALVASVLSASASCAGLLWVSFDGSRCPSFLRSCPLAS